MKQYAGQGGSQGGAGGYQKYMQQYAGKYTGNGGSQGGAGGYQQYMKQYGDYKQYMKKYQQGQGQGQGQGLVLYSPEQAHNKTELDAWLAGQEKQVSYVPG